LEKYLEGHRISRRAKQTCLTPIFYFFRQREKAPEGASALGLTFAVVTVEKLGGVGLIPHVESATTLGAFLPKTFHSVPLSACPLWACAHLIRVAGRCQYETPKK
jgi:hypothetical protein